MSLIFENSKRTPVPALTPYIAEYFFKRVKLPAGHTLIQRMPVWCQTTMDFFLGDEMDTVDEITGQVLPFSRCVFRGIRTHNRSYLKISGDFSVFIIRFTPSGFHGLMGIPASCFTDQAIDGTLVNQPLFCEITERLMACRNIDACVALVEPYLLNLATCKSRVSEPVKNFLKQMYFSRTPEPIICLQKKVNLSQRQLERNFLKEIGVSPKQYSRMIRFTNMLYQKMERMDTKWADLAYEFNYTDQTHLIKDFKHFLGVTPTQFISEDYAGFDDTPFGDIRSRL